MNIKKITEEGDFIRVKTHADGDFVYPNNKFSDVVALESEINRSIKFSKSKRSKKSRVRKMIKHFEKKALDDFNSAMVADGDGDV